MRRADKEVTRLEELEEILKACTAVHIGAQDGEGMFVVPMNYGFHLEGDRLTLYVHSAQEGRKVSAFRAGGTVAFEMDGRHALRTSGTACGHSYTYQSIMGSGPIRELTGREEKRAALGRIMEHMTGRGGWDMPDASLDRTAVFAIQADQWTGKRNQAG
ncbi:pyridoxamine 5'-phosphate oxidase family protein [Pseudoflavonifractor capillosus]|nr:pyridoxamine 5'-phosphate oxidase family protein [Pseudoflavonifractor capillosus]MBM6681518.1 pyridoxamine 5'-phosphate oxidase family protein [Pseudoflavonifractor capillosus]